MPTVGETWKQFELIELLGSGGMGDVFRARDTSLHRSVALKFLPEALRDDRVARERLLHEARSAASLDHPYICKIYEVGQAEGVAFIAMEYVEGSTLREKLSNGPLPLEELLRIAAEVVEAVEAAHQKNVVHRDLKAPNIMVTPDGHVKVMDFGLALQLTDDASLESKVSTFSGRLTAEGATPGTVIYMSPEQVRGEPLDARSDIFSLGVLLYEMATGRLPFRGATSGLTYDAILNRGAAPPRSLNPGVPVALENIVEKALQKEPDDRYQSAREMLVDLRALARDSSSGNAIETSFGAPRRVRRSQPNKTIWLGAGIVGALLVATFALFRSGPRVDDEAIRSLAVLPFENTRNDPEVDYLSDGIAESLINRMSQLQELEVKARSTSFRYRGSTLAPQEIGRELKVGAVLTGRVVQQDERLNVQAELVDVPSGGQLWGEQYNHPLADIVVVQNEIAAEISRALRLRLSGDEAAALAESASSEAYRAYLRGRYLWNKRTNEDFVKAIEFFESAHESDESYAPAYVGLADSYILLGGQFYGPSSAFPPDTAFAKARGAAESALELDPGSAAARASLGFIHFLNDWDWDAAERDFRESIRLDPGYATARQWYSVYLSLMNRDDEAIEQARAGLDLEPSSLVHNRHLGIVLFQARRYEEAASQLQRTLELDPDFPLTRYFFVLSHWLGGAREQAVADARAWGPSHEAFFRLLADGRAPEASDLLAGLDESEIPRRFRASYYALADDSDRALDVLEGYLQERHPLLPSIIMQSPAMDSLQELPRYTAIRRAMRLEP